MNFKLILRELKHHTPFTLIATILAVAITLMVYQKTIPTILFESIHSAHILASSIVTAAMYYKYKENITNALLIGITGAIIIGSLSDIIFPHLGAILFNLKTEFHLPLIHAPFMIIPIAFFGSLIGIATKYTKLPHLIHVFFSIFASLFYLLMFGITINLLNGIIIFLIVFIAVIIPCCVSDIIYPLLFLKPQQDNGKKV